MISSPVDCMCKYPAGQGVKELVDWSSCPFCPKSTEFCWSEHVTELSVHTWLRMIEML